MKTELANGCYSTNAGGILAYYNQQGQRHREDGPADIWYYNNESIRSEWYYINGRKHREDGPAVIWYNDDGSIHNEGYYINGLGHREDGPGYIRYNKDGSIDYEEYYLYGKAITKEQLNDQRFVTRIHLENIG